MPGKKKTTGKASQQSPMSSNCAKAKQIIRSEIKYFFGPSFGRGDKDALTNMQHAADQYNAGELEKYKLSDYRKGAGLVDAACFRIPDQDEVLSKIYGKEKVAGWDMDKRHEVYKHLIGREYAAMLSEREKAKQKKAEERAKKKEQAARKRTRVR